VTGHRQILTAPARRAAASSVCAAPGCRVIIRPHDLIVRLPGRGWAHAHHQPGKPDPRRQLGALAAAADALTNVITEEGTT